MIHLPDVTIRRATPDDAAEIANVHVNSWREAYRELLPEAYLNDLPLSFKGRMRMWRQVVTDTSQPLFVAEAKCGIVGFSAFGTHRDDSMAGYAELRAIYLLEKFKGKKIGAALLKIGMDELIQMKYSKAYCWVLERNPTIQFYERSGAVFNGMEKSEDIGGTKVKELAYEWASL